MTIKELIAELQTFKAEDSNLEVLLEGYEDGYTSLKKENITIATFIKNGIKERYAEYFCWFYGEHEKIGSDEINQDNAENIDVGLLLSRGKGEL